MLNGELGVTTTLRLKNAGEESTSIPWTASPVESIQLSDDRQSKTFGYEVATIDFYFGRPHGTNPSLSLRGEAALWSQPDNLSQHITLRPGEWVELRFRPRVLCSGGDSTSCLQRLQMDRLQISAWWYQRLLTRTMREGCIFESGAYSENEIDSDVVKITPAIPRAQPSRSPLPDAPKSP
jgi:hypothetical protein